MGGGNEGGISVEALPATGTPGNHEDGAEGQACDQDEAGNAKVRFDAVNVGGS